MIRVDRLVVPEAKSCCSTNSVRLPARAHSRAIATPLIPPPITITLNRSPSSDGRVFGSTCMTGSNFPTVENYELRPEFHLPESDSSRTKFHQPSSLPAGLLLIYSVDACPPPESASNAQYRSWPGCAAQVAAPGTASR